MNIIKFKNSIFNTLKYKILIIFLIGCLVLPGGLSNPKNSSAAIATLTVSFIVTTVLGSAAFGASLGAYSWFIEHGHFPKTDDERNEFIDKITHDALESVVHVLVLLVVAQLALIVGVVSSAAVAVAIVEGGDTLDNFVGAARPVVEAAHSIYLDMKIVIKDGADLYMEARQYASMFEFMKWFIDGWFFDVEVENDFEGQMRDTMKKTSLEENVTALINLQNQIEGISAINQFQPTNPVDDGPLSSYNIDDRFAFKTKIDTSLMANSPEGSKLNLFVSWYLYNFTSNQWVQIDATGREHTGTGWLGASEKTLSSMSFTGKQLLEKAGVSTDNYDKTKTIFLSSGWDMKVNEESVSSGQMHKDSDNALEEDDLPFHLLILGIRPSIDVKDEVTPNSGAPDDTYSFSLTYTDPSGNPPDTLDLFIDSETEPRHSFTIPDSANWKEGHTFSHDLSDFLSGSHSYKFEIKKGDWEKTTGGNFSCTRQEFKGDLAVSDMKLSSSQVYTNEKIKAEITLANNGNEDTDIIVNWYLTYPSGTHKEQKSETYSSVLRGKTKQASKEFTVDTSQGSWTIKAEIASSVDTNSGNNSVSKPFNVVVKSTDYSQYITTNNYTEKLDERLTEASNVYSFELKEMESGDHSKWVKADILKNDKLFEAGVNFNLNQVKTFDSKEYFVQLMSISSNSSDKIYTAGIYHGRPAENPFTYTPVIPKGPQGSRLEWKVTPPSGKINNTNSFSIINNSLVKEWYDKYHTEDNSLIRYFDIPSDAPIGHQTFYIRDKTSEENTKHYIKECKMTVEQGHDVSLSGLSPEQTDNIQAGSSVKISTNLNAAGSYVEFPTLNLEITGPDNYLYKDSQSISFSDTVTPEFTWETSGLDHGEYTLTLTASGVAADINTNNNEVSSTITLAGPVLETDKDEIELTAKESEDDFTDSITLSNSGKYAYDATITSDKEWIVIDTQSCSVDDTSSCIASFTIKMADLKEGYHYATLTVTAGNAKGSPKYINLVLQVTAPDPNFTITPENLNVEAGQESYHVEISAAHKTHEWEVEKEETDTWFTIDQTKGQGSQIITIDVEANTGEPRSSSLTITGKSFILKQEQGCQTQLSLNSENFAREGDSQEIDVDTAQGCAWTVSKDLSWITASPETGTGSGQVTITTEANTGFMRQGKVMISDQAFTVFQEGNKPVTIKELWPVKNAKAGKTKKLQAHVQNNNMVDEVPENTYLYFYVSGPEGTGQINAGKADISGLAPGQSGWYNVVWEIPGQTPAGMYRYWTQAVQSGREYSETSSGQDFIIVGDQIPGIPLLHSPSGTALNSTPAFQWESIPDAYEYKLQIYDKKEIEILSTVYLATIVDQKDGTCSIISDHEFYPGQYTWQITASNINGEAPASKALNFNIPYSLEITNVNRAACSSDPGIVLLTATIKNTGNLAVADCEVWFYIDGPNWEGTHWIGSKSVTDLSPTETREYIIKWSYPADSEGEFYYRTQVFNDDDIALSDVSDDSQFTLPCEGVSAQDYFPLLPEMEWQTTNGYYKNIGSKVVEGKETMMQGWDQTNGPWTSTSYLCLTNNADGLYAHGSGHGTSGFSPFSSPLKILNPAVYKGDVIENIITVPGDDLSIAYRVLSISETISVPAGTFENCIKLEQTILSEAEGQLIGKNNIWLSPGIGKVKGETLIDSEYSLFPESEELIFYQASSPIPCQSPIKPGTALPLSPNNTVHSDILSFEWDEVPCSNEYKLTVEDSVENPIHNLWYKASDICTNGTCSVSLDLNLPDDDYIWWIRTGNGDIKGDWSEGMPFSYIQLTTYYLDSDSDGYGDPGISQTALSQPQGYVEDATDCNDTDSGIYPGAKEKCNGIDENCDQIIDNGVPEKPVQISPSGSISAVAPSFTWQQAPCATAYKITVWNEAEEPVDVNSEWQQASDICADNTCSISPNITLPNGNYQWWLRAENDYGKSEWSEGANFSTAEVNTYFLDSDNDGYGDPDISQIASSQPQGYVSDNTDCNDADPDIHPGALESCNNEDDNCNSIVDEKCGTVCDGVPIKVEQISPSGDTESTTVTFTWKHDSCTSGYQLEIMNRLSQFVIFDQSFEIEDNDSKYPEVVCAEGVCTLVLETHLEQGNYRWWVRGWNENGNGSWSDDGDFSVVTEKKSPSKVTPISPTGNTENTNPVFNWTKDINTTWYKLWVGYPGDEKIFGQWYDAANICSESNCSVTPELDLQNGDYEWYVKSWNDDGKVWNDGMTFSVAVDDIEVLSKDYFPLSIGMEWTGTVYRYKNIGYKDVNGVKTVKHAADWNENGQDIDPWNEAEYDCYTNDSEGLMVHGVGEGSDTFIAPSAPVKILNATVRIGDVINNTFPEIDPDLILQYSVLSISETITVPAGTFNNCIKLTEEIINSPSNPSYEKKFVWLAPGVGKIKVESITGGDGGMFWESEELISYADPINDNCTDVPEWISLTAPSLNIKDTTPTFTWREEPCTYSYEFMLKQGNTAIAEQWFDPSSICSNGECSINLGFELDTEDYEWFVRGSNELGNGDWGDGLEFMVTSSIEANMLDYHQHNPGEIRVYTRSWDGGLSDGNRIEVDQAPFIEKVNGQNRTIFPVKEFNYNTSGQLRYLYTTYYYKTADSWILWKEISEDGSEALQNLTFFDLSMAVGDITSTGSELMKISSKIFPELSSSPLEYVKLKLSFESDFFIVYLIKGYGEYVLTVNETRDEMVNKYLVYKNDNEDATGTKPAWFDQITTDLDDSIVEELDNPYFEPHVGDYFQYKEEPVNGSGYAPRLMHVDITGKQTIGGKTYFVYEYTEEMDNGNSDSWNHYLREDSTGNVWFRPSVNAEEILYMEWPLDIGDEATFYSSSWSMLSRVQSLTDTATVPAGKFTDCLKFYIENSYPNNPQDNTSGYEWFAPDIGTVKESDTRKTSVLTQAIVDGETIGDGYVPLSNLINSWYIDSVEIVFNQDNTYIINEIVLGNYFKLESGNFSYDQQSGIVTGTVVEDDWSDGGLAVGVGSEFAFEVISLTENELSIYFISDDDDESEGEAVLTTTPPYAPSGNILDNFNDNSVNENYWETEIKGDGKISEQNQMLILESKGSGNESSWSTLSLRHNGYTEIQANIVAISANGYSNSKLKWSPYGDQRVGIGFHYTNNKLSLYAQGWHDGPDLFYKSFASASFNKSYSFKMTWDGNQVKFFVDNVHQYTYTPKKSDIISGYTNAIGIDAYNDSGGEIKSYIDNFVAKP